MTNSAAEQSGAVDAGRIRCVTEHFQQLQGLGTAALGASWTLTRLGRDLQLPAFWMILALSTMGWVSWAYCTDYFPRYNQRRFGAIEQKPVPSKWGIFTQWSAFDAVVLTVMWFGRALRFEQLLLLAFSLYFVVTLSGMWRSREISVDPRNIYLLPAMLAMVWIYSYPMWHTPESGHATLWKMLGDLAMPVFVMVTGLCDHLLLLRLMPERTSEEEYDG